MEIAQIIDSIFEYYSEKEMEVPKWKTKSRMVDRVPN